MKKREKVDSISLLSRNLQIKGDISGNENLRVDGAIKGSINVSGDVVIEETGMVEADISGGNIIVKGSVNGNISANHRIEIHATGIVIGDISARSVDIQEGAKFEGRSRMVKADSNAEETLQISGVHKNNKKEEKAGVTSE